MNNDLKERLQFLLASKACVEEMLSEMPIEEYTNRYSINAHLVNDILDEIKQIEYLLSCQESC